LPTFSKHYKDLEKDKWVKVIGWESKEMAEKIILDGISAAKKRKTGTETFLKRLNSP
jgi:inorganic pyrophosphatase